ncbi:transposase (plasmid) [Bradyrhizobium sp. 187]|nr:transposase [Bradyrhizobium sp. 187]
MLLGIARSGVYRPPRPANDNGLALMQRIDELFTAWPFLGSRRMTTMLKAEGLQVNRKRVQRLMRQDGHRGAGTEAEHDEAGAGTGQTRCGRPTSRICPSAVAFSISSPSSTGRAVRFWRGGCRTRWTSRSAWRLWKRRWRRTARRRFSTRSSCCAADRDRSCGLAFAHVLALPPDTRVKSSGRLVQQLLLPGIDLVRVNLMALARSATVACSRTACSAIFAFNAASIFRRVFSSSCPPSIKRSGPFPTKPLVLKSGSISIMVAGTRSNGTRGDLFTDGPCRCDEPCPVEDVHVGRPTVRLARSPPPQCEARGFCHSLSNTRTTRFAAH